MCPRVKTHRIAYLIFSTPFLSGQDTLIYDDKPHHTIDTMCGPPVTGNFDDYNTLC